MVVSFWLSFYHFLLQILQLVLLGVRVGCVTDWEQNNFGIRTEHHKDDLINKVNLDENAPRLIKTQKRQRHSRKSTKKHEKQKLNFRVRGRGRDRSLGDIERPSILTRNPLRPQLIRDNKVAASIKNKPSFADFKENYLGISRAVSSVGEDEVRRVNRGKWNLMIFCRKLWICNQLQLVIKSYRDRPN